MPATAAKRRAREGQAVRWGLLNRQVTSDLGLRVSVPGRMCTRQPEGVLQEVREDVTRVYKGFRCFVALVTEDFGVSPPCLKRWLSIDERSSA